MFPTGAAVNDSDQIMIQNGVPVQQALASAPLPNLPPPNPSLGDAMRNRDWHGREQQSYYEMQQAPMPHQFTHDRPHPQYGGGEGNQLTQWMPPPGPPTGFAAQQAPVVYGFPQLPPRPTRPTFAINRVLGAQNRVPVMYATWPSQYFPGGSNGYVPSFEATGMIIKYTRDVSRFRVNRYVKGLKVDKDQGYYLTLGAQDPYRVVSVNDYLWEDSADAPGGRQERQAFGFNPYRTARYCFPFSLGKKSVDQAAWPILAEHSRMAAAKAMTVRTILSTSVATTTANWSGTGFTNTSAVSAAWTTSPTANNYIQTDINTAMIAIEQASGGIVTDEDALHITMNPTLARGIARSPELKTYLQGSPDALAVISDQRNPNRKYGLAPMLYGLELVIENAVRVTTPKPANVASPASTSQSYIWATANVVISSKPQGLSSEGEQSLDFSTFTFVFYEQTTIESKSDVDNRREIGRVVEDYVCQLRAPQTGYFLSGAS